MRGTRKERKWMKKLLSMVICLAVLLAGCAFAEGEEAFSFEALKGVTFELSSGAGAWSVEVEIAGDGSFIGSYHDSDMGDVGEGYPNGTIYICKFQGNLSVVGRVSDTAWQLSVDGVAVDSKQDQEEYLEDGVRYVLSDPTLKDGDLLTLYLPGQPVAELSEEFLLWMHLDWYDEEYKELPFYALRNEKDDTGYVGMDYSSEDAEY